MNKVTGKPTQRPNQRPKLRAPIMTEVRAIQVAVKLCKLELKRMAFDRNAYQRYGARYPEAVKAATRSVELERVVETLDRLRNKS